MEHGRASSFETAGCAGLRLAKGRTGKFDRLRCAAAMAEIDKILAATIKNPVGPGFMAPPEKAAA